MDLSAPQSQAPGGVERFGRLLLAHAGHRLQLLALEVAEEKIRVGRALAWGALAVFLACLTIVLAVMFVVVAAWDTPARLHVIGWTALAGLGATAFVWRLCRQHAQAPSALFAHSLAELYKDAEALHEGAAAASAARANGDARH